MENQHHEHEESIELKVHTPVGKWDHRFHIDSTVETVITGAIDHFHGKLTGDSYELRKKGSEEPLNPAETLKAAHLHSDEVVILLPSKPGGGK